MLFTEHLEQKSKEFECGMFSPPTTDNEAFNFVCSYLLGDDWIAYSSITNAQVNTEQVHDILFKYSRKYRKEYRNYIKKHKEVKKCWLQRLFTKTKSKRK